ncbi:hypothetical protein Bca101_031684 [Brassica carinata]
MSTSAGGNKSPGDATPLAGSAMVPVQVLEVSAQPSGSSTTPVPAPKEEKGDHPRGSRVQCCSFDQKSQEDWRCDRDRQEEEMYRWCGRGALGNFVATSCQGLF